MLMVEKFISEMQKLVTTKKWMAIGEIVQIAHVKHSSTYKHACVTSEVIDSQIRS